MKILYLDVTMGAAGDMLTSSLVELFEDRMAVMNSLNGMGIPDVVFDVESKSSCGIAGTHMKVTVGGISEDEIHEHHHDHDHEHHHHHASMHDIEHIIGHLNVSDKVKADAIAVYKIIAEAESKAHGVSTAEIHFHEVGTKDAIADIVAVCSLIRELSPDRIIASRVCTGFGHVHCAHGTLPVPAPATANIIEGMPVFGGHEEGERLTPTGAALIRYFADSFGSLPEMTITRSGYGIGTKEFEGGNFVRSSIGESLADDLTDQVMEYAANVDDMTAEQLGFAMEMIYDSGAVEVFTTPVTMKKSRPGTLITVISPLKNKDQVLGALFKYTSTIGVRERMYKRNVLKRTIRTKQTPLGDVRIKDSSGYGVTRSKYEYEDISRIARENNMSYDEVIEKIR